MVGRRNNGFHFFRRKLKSDHRVELLNRVKEPLLVSGCTNYIEHGIQPIYARQLLIAASESSDITALGTPELPDQNFRRSRRRDFNVETHHAQPRAFGNRSRFSQTRFEAPSGPPIHGVVKWFSPEKGFGFVELSDGSGDAFLHGSVLAQSGINAVEPGETVKVRVGPGHKGPHVTEVLSLDSSTATAAEKPRPNYTSATANRPSSDVSVGETGTVKWFNAEKGYGFITRDNGEEDLFVHISAVERSGLAVLSEGDRVIVDVAEGRKGLEVARVRLI
jgi:CspA family cold shock protein